jgi:hypothetical protein
MKALEELGVPAESDSVGSKTERKGFHYQINHFYVGNHLLVSTLGVPQGQRHAGYAGRGGGKERKVIVNIYQFHFENLS